MKKNILLLILIVNILYTQLIGCASAEEQEERKITIAVSMIGETHKWPIGVQYYAEKEIKEIAEENGWNYLYVVGEDSTEQSNQVIDMVRQKVDCIIMLPMDGASLKTAAMAVQDANIPLVIFDREIPDFAPTATVKGDNVGIGVMTADIFNGMFPDGTKVLEIMGDTSTVPQQRTDGFDQTIHSNFTKEQVSFTGWNRDKTKEIFKEWASSHTQDEIDEVQAIFTHDDEIALGVLDALDEYADDTEKVVSFDNLKVIAGSAGDQEMYRRIDTETKYTLFSLTYSPAMICTAIRIGEKIIKGEDYDEMTVISTVEVNKRNVDSYIDPNAPY